MAVKIRLKRMGKIRTPFYRVVVADSRTKRDGRVIEEIGTYNPKTEPSVVEINSERAQYWLGVGAQPSEAVTALLKLTGDFQAARGEKVEPTLRTPEPKRDKAEVFNEALKAVHGEPAAAAVTSSKKSDDKPAKGKSEEKPAKGKSDDKPAKGKSEEKPAEEKPAETEAAEA